jgi:hypothetical protein
VTTHALHDVEVVLDVRADLSTGQSHAVRDLQMDGRLSHEPQGPPPINEFFKGAAEHSPSHARQAFLGHVGFLSAARNGSSVCAFAGVEKSAWPRRCHSAPVQGAP